MSQREELGCRFSVRPGIANDDPFVRLPFLVDTGKIAGAGMGAHAHSDEFVMACQDLETLPGCPEHQAGVAERQGMSCEFQGDVLMRTVTRRRNGGPRGRVRA